MKNSDLIKLLQKYGDETHVFISTPIDPSNEEIRDIVDVDDNKKYVKLVTGTKKMISPITDGEDTVFEITLNDEDTKFIENVNKELKQEDRIDVNDAAKASAAFQEDFKKWYTDKYNKLAHEGMTKLFENDKQLDYRTIGDLKYYVYRNGWQNEINKELLSNKQALINFLYNKLDEYIKDNIYNNRKNFLKDEQEEIKNTDTQSWMRIAEKELGELLVGFSDVFKQFNHYYI